MSAPPPQRLVPCQVYAIMLILLLTTGPSIKNSSFDARLSKYVHRCRLSQNDIQSVMSRLRPVRRHDQYGYISRVDGDRQLSDYGTQETFFSQLVDVYDLKPLCFSDEEDTLNIHKKSDPELQDESKCLSSLRKLREGIIASNRRDVFATDVFERVARYSIAQEHMESYFPTLQHLHYVLYPAVCSDDKRHEKERQIVNDLLALHLCSQEKYREAIELRLSSHKAQNGLLVDKIIRAQIHHDWIAWTRLLSKTNALQRVLANRINRRMSEIALKSISSAYMTVDVAWIGTICGDDWQTTTNLPKCTVEDDKVIFKRGKPSKAIPS